MTLGFLKKKKTKEVGNPNSPISPSDDSTASQGDWKDSVTTGSSHTLESSHTNTSDGTRPVSQGVPQIQPPTSAPRSTGQDPIAPPTANSDGPTSNNASAPQTDGTAQSQTASKPNGARATPAQMAATSSPAPAVRTTKGKYSLTDFTLQRTLGTGSFGRVHLVQSNHNQRFYAIKVLKKAQVVKMKQVEHTNDERKMLQKCKHAFLVTMWGTFQDSKNLYMVMDFVEGGELFSLLRKSQVGEFTFVLYHYQHHNFYKLVRLRNKSGFPIQWPSSMRQRSLWRSTICIRNISSTGTLSPRTCCWIGTVISRSQTLGLQKRCLISHGLFVGHPIISRQR